MVKTMNHPGFTEAVPPVADPTASIVIVSTDELHHLRTCLPSLRALEGTPPEVLVVDNASDDGTAEVLAVEYPWVRIVRSDRRLGYAGANNLGFRHARGTYLIVLNPDTAVEPGFVSALVNASRARRDRALVTSLVCYYDQPTVVNTCGNVVQFGLLTSCRGIGLPRSAFSREELVAAISGAAFLIPRVILERIGPFDEATFFYLEDTELSLRAQLAGYECVTCPASVVYHKYELRMLPRKFFYIERNRWIVMLRTYRWRTLLLLFPALAATEILSWLYAAGRGWRYIAAKARAYGNLVRLSPDVRRARGRTQRLRAIPDAVLLSRMQGALPVERLAAENRWISGAVRLVNLAYMTYFSVVRRAIRW